VIDLLDVNVLVSLGWPNHVHHSAALHWFRNRGSQPWATTPFTEAGFVRVSCNTAAIPSAVSPSEAIALLRRMRELEGHQFLVDDVPLVVGSEVALERVGSYRQISDAHLLAIARRNRAQLVTFDRGMASLGSERDVVIIPPHR
jgi:toxin-antitoxin system PIN domain toxin